MNVQVVDYSEKAVAIFGAETEVENQMKAAGGMFCQTLKTGAGVRPGWIFSKKHEVKVREMAGKINATCENYSEKSVVVWLNQNHVNELIAAKGMYNAHLKAEDGTVKPGWIFAKARQEKVIELAKALAA